MVGECIKKNATIYLTVPTIVYNDRLDFNALVCDILKTIAYFDNKKRCIFNEYYFICAMNDILYFLIDNFVAANSPSDLKAGVRIVAFKDGLYPISEELEGPYTSISHITKLSPMYKKLMIENGSRAQKIIEKKNISILSIKNGKLNSIYPIYQSDVSFNNFNDKKLGNRTEDSAM